MSRGYFRRRIFCIVAIVAVFSQIGLGIAFADIIPTAVGDDPGVTISGPESISSRDQVELNVTLSASAGRLDEDGSIKIAIPKSIVNNKNDLTSNLVIDDPFYLSEPAVVEDELGNYVLNVQYDHTKINPQSATGETFTIKFAAPYLNVNDETKPDSVSFKADLNKGSELVSTDNATSTVKKATSSLAILSKWSTRPSKVVNGVRAALMSESNPASNIFAITVNYNQTTINDAKLVDTTPKGTELTDPGTYIPATGNATPFEHIRIAKVTSRQENGSPNAWEYVTSDFSDKITTSPNGFEISFGDLSPDDSYVVMYAEKVIEKSTPEEFGVRYNHVDLYSSGNLFRSYDTAIALDDSGYNSVSLTKAVKQSTLSTTNGDLEYSLRLKSNNGTIPAGTVISDSLPEFTTFLETTGKDDSMISDVTYDSETNVISYTLLKDILEGETQELTFKVRFSNPNALPGEKIINRASINYAGTNIYSNDAITTLDGSAYLYKFDQDNQNPLAGAEFQIVDSTGRIVADGLVSDEKGFINSGLLQPGDYQFIETKAPEGYQLEKSPIDFTVVSGQETPINLTKSNKLLEEEEKLGGVILNKIDSQDKTPLSGAEFDLLTDSGTVVQTKLVTDKQGKIKVDNLPVGNYQFIETKAPENYRLDQTPVKFTISENNEKIIELTIGNTRISKKPDVTKPNIGRQVTTDMSKDGVNPSTTNNSISVQKREANNNRERFPKTNEITKNIVMGSTGLALVGIAIYYIRKK
ncbi:hypothetical protein BH743_12270 [Enterococcus faecium]|uniref:SpaA isopeptide-forming pilin-related protein n=1 Tax=Enterococcus TaxID=1350 RepID=UPI0009BF3376|nr:MULTISPECIES: SpaA isopeptide-forming pilin-related protein [Enterococcus]OQO64453.1 hypothetical protein BH743_12270 [Enterococcus faecium]OTO22006.1 hypothetical protein A5816_003052 [Enterococcus sp. 3G1_DIV0629]